MEERKLNINNPLLSVRRNKSGASMNSVSLLKGRTDETSRPRNQQKILASTNVHQSMDQVTEPVSIPFMWEEVPGKAKDDGEPEFLPTEETVPAIPVIVATNSSSILGDYLEKESRERSQTEKDSVMYEDERYSDAVDTLSPDNSFSVSCSVSNLSGSDGTDMKLSRTFSVDMQTRDFMMDRFLTAARAMAIASESSLYCASRKRHMLLTEQPKEVEKPRLLAIESGTPSRHHNMEVMKYCTQALCQTESGKEEEEQEEGEDDCSTYSTVTEKGCGLLPQLCLRSSLRLLNPVPELKSKIKNSIPFVPAIKKELKAESITESVIKSGGPQLRSEHQVKTPVSEVGEIKPPGGLTRRNFSGELQKIGRLSPFRSRRNDAAISDKRESPQPVYAATPLDGMKRLSLSGELRSTRKLSPFRSSRTDVTAIPEKNESPQPPHVGPMLGASSRVDFSGELRITGRFSPFRPLRNDNVLSEKGEPPLGRVSQHNFSSELRTTSRLSPFRPLRNDVANLEKNDLPRPSYVVPPLGGPSLSLHNFSGELRPASQLSPFRALRGDVTVSEEKELSSHPSYAVPPLGWPGRPNFSGEMQTQHRQSPLQPPRNHTTTLRRVEKKDVSMLNNANGCIHPASPAFERTLYADTVNVGRDSFSNLDALDREVWIDPVASREVEKTPTGESSFQDIECLNVMTQERTLKEINDGVVDPPSLPLPSLKSPSKSWLWHALPSNSDRSLFSSLQKTAPPSKKHDSDTHAANAKWETIVKTSKTHHDHTRYSEELVVHSPQQYKS